MRKIEISYIFSFLFVLFFSSIIAQPKAEGNFMNGGDSNLTLTCVMSGCKQEAPLYLFQFDGYTFVPVQTATPDENNTFTFKVPLSEHQFYFLGQAPNNTKPIILGKEKDLTLQGNCNNIRKSAFANSPLNSDYEVAIGQIRGYQGTTNMLNQQYARAPIGSDRKAQFLLQMKDNDKAQMELLNSMKAKHPFVAKIVATKTYLSYPNNKGSYENEIQYYLDQVFAYLDLKDPDLDRMPAIYETFRDYTNTLVAIQMDRPALKGAVDNVIGKMNADSKAYRYALGAIMQTLKGKNHPAFIDYANLFIKKYEGENLPYMADLKKGIDDVKNFMIGAVAPDFEQNTPEGNPMKLSDLRGKVVLVDFWASWCGPCRRENPNVVRLYNKYKDQGFEVLGVSLDKGKEKWLKAIEKDGLTWSHVSDLKGWGNTVAKQYSVRSIPHTLLLDQEGRILAKNLRGEGLAKKLEELFEK